MEIQNRINRKIHYWIDLLWNAAYQHDLNKATKQTQRKTFISHQKDPCDDFEHDSEEEDSTDDQNQDEPSPCSVFQSSLNSTAPKKPTKFFIPYQLWGEFPEGAKQMVIEYNKKIKVVSPKPHFHGGKSKPNLTLAKPNSNPQQVHLHEKDDPTRDQPPETPTQTMVHQCLSECGTDQTITISCQSLMPKVAFHHKIPQEQFKFIKDMP